MSRASIGVEQHTKGQLDNELDKINAERAKSNKRKMTYDECIAIMTKLIKANKSKFLR